MRLYDYLIQQDDEASKFMEDMENNKDSFLPSQSHLHVIGTCGYCEYWGLVRGANREFNACTHPEYHKKCSYFVATDGCIHWKDKS